MKIPFVKMHGLGNDYVYLDAVTRPEIERAMSGKRWPGIVRAISDRHTGIGSDGVIVVTKPRNTRHDAGMRMFNADGSEGRMCGNGARCVAKFAHDRLGLGAMVRGKATLAIEVGPPGRAGGVLAIEGRIEAGRLVQATVDMGKPVLDLRRIGVDRRRLAFKGVEPHWGVQREFMAGHEERSVCLIAVFVSMGNPHMVVMEPAGGAALNLTAREVAAVPLEVLGPLFETHPAFPDRINVHFAAVQRGRRGTPGAKSKSDRIVMRTWERGAGQTRACASGACATLVAAAVSGRCGRRAVVAMPGGELDVRWDPRTGRVFQSGPAIEVFEGVWPG